MNPNINPNMDSIQPSLPPQTQDVAPTAIPVSEQEKDTIEKSQQEEIINLYLMLINLIAGLPQLETPKSEQGVQPLSIQEAVNNILSKIGFNNPNASDEQVAIVAGFFMKIQQITTDVLQKWGDTVKAIDTEIRERLNSLEYQRQVEEKSLSFKNKEEDKQPVAIENVVARANARLEILNSADPEILQQFPAFAAAVILSVTTPLLVPPPLIPGAAGGLGVPGIQGAERPVIGRTFAGDISMDDSSTVAERTMRDGVIQINPELRPDILGQLGALVAMPLFQTVVNEGAKVLGKAGDPNLYAQARTFAQEVLKLSTQENALATLLAPYLKNLPDVRPAGSDVLTKEEFLALSKLILGMVSLALLLRTQKSDGEKKFTDADADNEMQRITNMILNENPEDEKDPLVKSLLILIVNQLSILKGHPQLPELVERILEYLFEKKGTDPKKMFHPTKVLRDTLGSRVHPRRSDDHKA